MMSPHISLWPVRNWLVVKLLLVWRLPTKSPSHQMKTRWMVYWLPLNTIVLYIPSHRLCVVFTKCTYKTCKPVLFALLHVGLHSGASVCDWEREVYSSSSSHRCQSPVGFPRWCNILCSSSQGMCRTLSVLGCCFLHQVCMYPVAS